MSVVSKGSQNLEVSKNLQPIFPVISCLSAKPKVISIVTKVVGMVNQLVIVEDVITNIDSTPVVESSSKVSPVLQLLNQVSSDTGVIVLDINPGSELDPSSLSFILCYLEDVFKNITVIIIAEPDDFLKEECDKIINAQKAPRNDYHLVGGVLELTNLYFIILTHIRKTEQQSALNVQLELLKSERKNLNKYFSEDVIQEILFGGMDSNKSASRQCTIMFLDIRNFTGISEKLEPGQVVELLDLLFTDIVDLIFSGKGSVNKFIGDAILATFGCPRSYGDDVENAVRCAINLIAALSLFNQVKPTFLKDDISLGIGIATGKVFAGNVGSHRKMEYTVIGDTVNLASRLQGMTKELSCKLIVDSETRASLVDKVPFEKTDVHSVRGKKEKLDIYYLPDAYFDEM